MQVSHTNRLLLRVLICGTLALVTTGCAGGHLHRARKLAAENRTEEALAAYTRLLALDSDRGQAFFERGYLEYGRGRFVSALADFSRARSLKPGRAEYHLHYGFTADTLGLIDSALAGYGEFLLRERKGELAAQARARQFALTERKLEHEISAALAREETLVTPADRRVVALLAPDAVALPEQFRPLALALADFAATDLKQVTSLAVVERRRIDALERELNLSREGLVDPQSAPRTGRLMGAGTLVGGRLQLLSDSTLRYDGVAYQAPGSRSPLPVAERLQQFLELEKQLVFALIDTLGVSLTRAERDAIGKPATESFLAILAYARGLDAERKGDFGAAQRNFEHAQELDPNFGLAGVRSQEAADQAAAPATGPQTVAAAAQEQNRQTLERRPLLRQMTGFDAGDFRDDRPYTGPGGLTRDVVIEVELPDRREF